MLTGLLVLLGWTLDLSWLKSVLPGAVQMKPNTAVGLVLSAVALFLVADCKQAERSRPTILSVALAVAALGAASLGQDVFGWRLGIDELLFRDTAHAYNAIPGRMSPYTAFSFLAFGMALAAWPVTALRSGIWLLLSLVASVGVVSLLGYAWNANVVVTDVWVPPVAVHAALALVLLAIGAMRALRDAEAGPGAAAPTRISIEFKIAAGFAGAFLLLVTAGGITYQTSAAFARSAHMVAETHEVRAQLGQFIAAVLNAETEGNNYLLLGEAEERNDFAKDAREAHEHEAALAALLVDRPVQRRLLDEMSALAARRLRAMEQAIAARDLSGIKAARAVLEKGGGIHTMDKFRALAREMNQREAERLVQRETRADGDRKNSLGFLLLTIVGAAAIFTILFYSIRREMLARRGADEAVRALNAGLERRVEERTSQLSYQQALLRRVMDLNRSLIFAKDREGRFVLANDAVAEAYGTTADAIIGKTDADFNRNADEVERFRRADLEAIDSGSEVVIGEERITDAAGRVRWLHTVKRPMRSPDDKSTMLLGVSVDITERKRAEEEVRQLTADLERRVEDRTRALVAANQELEQARSDAEAANRAKSAFLATMSHEIRTPMNGVIGMVEVLARSGLAEHQIDAVRTIRASAFSLLGLIEDILDFSKIEAGRMELERMPVALPELIESVCDTLMPVSIDKGVELSLFIHPQVPHHVWTDPTRLRQVLYNLAGNAIKFSSGRPQRPGRVSVRVDVSEATPRRLIVRIVDNGIGMSAETLNHLYSSFKQAEASTTRRFGGTGLGLAICKRLVTLMDGDIEAQSVPDEGSTFVVTLPVEEVAAAVPASYADLANLDCIIVGSDLPVDDLRVYLEHAGARVHLVATVDAAARRATGLDRSVVVQWAQRDSPQPEALLAAFADTPDTGHLLLASGRRRRARVTAADLVTMDGNCLRRAALLRAVAVAAGRASPEVLREESAEDAASERVETPSIAEARAQGRLVLIAEDDAINQKVILRQLEILGYAAEIADNGVEALRLWRDGRYGLLLTDLHMPQMDGYRLVEAIRAAELEQGVPRQERMPIMALTANALRSEAVRAHEAGMDEYLTKPLQLAVLKVALTKWLPHERAAPTEEVRMPDPPAPEAAVLDVGVLESRVGNNPRFVRELLAEFRASVRRLAAELRAAYAAADLAQIGAIAHKLKSSSRSVGALALGDLCAELENSCRAGSAEAVARGIGRFGVTVRSVDAELDRFFLGG